jgi:ATP-dependent Zn protease
VSPSHLPEVKKILRQSYDRAQEVLINHRTGLDRVAKELIEKEEVSGSRVVELVGVEKTVAAPGKQVSTSSPM